MELSFPSVVLPRLRVFAWRPPGRTSQGSTRFVLSGVRGRVIVTLCRQGFLGDAAMARELGVEVGEEGRKRGMAGSCRVGSIGSRRLLDTWMPA